MTNKNNKLLALNEIVGAYILPQFSDEEIQAFREDSVGFLNSQLGTDFDDGIAVVENTADEVHLALPYYSTLEQTTATALSDDDLDEIVGGEILISIFVACGFAAGVGVAAAASIGGTGVVALAAIGATAGGVIGTAVVATSVTAGI